MAAQASYDCSIIRGGSSKGIYLSRDELPPPGRDRDALILRMFGSPDVRQIDGLGGADKLTSKVAVMGAPTRPDADIDYLFGQVNIALPRIDWESNCGNLAAGAALYAALRMRYRPGAADVADIRIHQVNTGRLLRARVPMHLEAPLVHGDFVIGGVPGSAARIDLDFTDFAGCTLNKGVLPLGAAVSALRVPGLARPVHATVVDFGNVCIFVDARTLPFPADVRLTDLQSDETVVDYLESIRSVVALTLGIASPHDLAQDLLVKMNPLLFMVQPPRNYHALDGGVVSAASHDLWSFSITRRAFSKAYPGTGSLATSIAAALPGTVVNAMLGDAVKEQLRIGHPSGVLTVEQQQAGAAGTSRVVLGRTARLLMQGRAYVPATMEKEP